MDRLRKEYEEKNMRPLFSALAPLLAGQTPPDYAALASGLDMEAGALRTALPRMRKRYRECLVQEIAGTVASPDLVAEELAALIASVRSAGR